MTQCGWNLVWYTLTFLVSMFEGRRVNWQMFLLTKIKIIFNASENVARKMFQLIVQENLVAICVKMLHLIRCVFVFNSSHSTRTFRIHQLPINFLDLAFYSLLCLQGFKFPFLFIPILLRWLLPIICILMFQKWNLTVLEIIIEKQILPFTSVSPLSVKLFIIRQILLGYLQLSSKVTALATDSTVIYAVLSQH